MGLIPSVMVNALAHWFVRTVENAESEIVKCAEQIGIGAVASHITWNPT
jgi:hypothetical protein